MGQHDLVLLVQGIHTGRSLCHFLGRHQSVECKLEVSYLIEIKHSIRVRPFMQGLLHASILKSLCLQGINEKFRTHNCSNVLRLRRFVEAVLKYTGQPKVRGCCWLDRLIREIRYRSEIARQLEHDQMLFRSHSSLTRWESLWAERSSREAGSPLVTVGLFKWEHSEFRKWRKLKPASSNLLFGDICWN